MSPEVRRCVPGGAPQDGRRVVFVCQGASCGERGGDDFVDRVRGALARAGLHRRVRLCTTTCLDSCATGPNVLLGHEQGIRTGLAPEGLPGLLADPPAEASGAA